MSLWPLLRYIRYTIHWQVVFFLCLWLFVAIRRWFVWLITCTVPSLWFRFFSLQQCQNWRFSWSLLDWLSWLCLIEWLHCFFPLRPSKARSNEDDEAFTGDLLSYEDLFAWAQEKCNPLVRHRTTHLNHRIRLPITVTAYNLLFQLYFLPRSPHSISPLVRSCNNYVFLWDSKLLILEALKLQFKMFGKG